MADPTFIDILQQQARNRPQALAYRCGERRWTFADVERDTNRLANALVALGVGAGDRVAALTKFHVEALLLTLAAAKLGAVFMPVNWRLAPAELRYIVDHGGAKLMLADRGFLPLVDRAGMPSLQQVLVTEGTHDGLPGFNDWFAAASDVFAAVAAKPADALLQLYSSGTTGLPKGVVLSHAGLIFNCQLGFRTKFDQVATIYNPSIVNIKLKEALLGLPGIAGNQMQLSFSQNQCCQNRFDACSRWIFSDGFFFDASFNRRHC